MVALSVSPLDFEIAQFPAFFIAAFNHNKNSFSFLGSYDHVRRIIHPIDLISTKTSGKL